MNLCTNAMQAMETGGLLNVVLERGPYVRLFDPFFTTKEIGANEVLRKPPRRRDLAEALARVLESVNLCRGGNSHVGDNEHTHSGH
jgi:hypothetical protein